MVRIATTSLGAYHASEHYRIQGPFERMVEDNLIVFNRLSDQDIADGELANYDIFFFWNPSHPKSLAYIKAAQLAKCKIWIDFDDNWAEIPMYHPHSWRTNPAFQKELNKKIVSEATVVTVTTEELYELGKQFNPNTYIVPNALPNKITNDHRKKNKVIGWRGSDRHMEDIRHGMKGLIKDSALQYHFVGFSPWYLYDAKIDYSYTTWSNSLQEYFNNLYTINMEYCWIPMINNVFNRSVSNIAFLEATSVGAVCIIPEWLEEFNVGHSLWYKNHKELKSILTKIANNELDDVRNRYLAECVNVINEKFILNETNKIRKNIIESLG